MRIGIWHETIYEYATPLKSAIQILRLTPRSHEGQHVASWRIDVDADCRLRESEDAYGNIVHRFDVAGPLSRLAIIAEGEIETFDTSGVVRNAVERFPPEFFLRTTPLTAADAALRDFAAARRGGGDIETLHRVSGDLHATLAFDVDPTHVHTSAAEAFALGRGVCQDFAQAFIACARSLGFPARYVGGHFLRSDGVTAQDAGHAWAEAFVDGLGWVGFDPAHGVSVHESHVRVACGLDYLDAAPVRGARAGGADERLSVAVGVRDAQSRGQAQN